MDRLSRYGFNLSFLNHYLDEVEFPKSVGRFPEMFSTYPELSDIISSSVTRFMCEARKYSSYDERRKSFKTYLSSDVANYLSNSPTAFRSIFENEGFLLAKKFQY